MGDRNGIFTIQKRYLGHKRNGGDWQDGVTRVQTNKLTGRAGGRGDKGHRQVCPMCLPE